VGPLEFLAVYLFPDKRCILKASGSEGDFVGRCGVIFHDQYNGSRGVLRDLTSRFSVFIMIISAGFK